jgi:hypothetical protein
MKIRIIFPLAIFSLLTASVGHSDILRAENNTVVPVGDSVCSAEIDKTPHYDSTGHFSGFSYGGSFSCDGSTPVEASWLPLLATANTGVQAISSTVYQFKSAGYTLNGCGEFSNNDFLGASIQSLTCLFTNGHGN